MTNRPITSSSFAAPCSRAPRTTSSSRRIERESGKKYGEGFGVSVNPEFLREGTALKDFRKPPLTLVGHNHAADATGTIALYQSIDAPLISTSIRVAEMMKYTSNTWHALKVCFANEIGNLCKEVGVDSHEVMDIFCRDEKLNLSLVLSQARIRVRRIVPAEGRARAAISGEGGRPRSAGHFLDPAAATACRSSTRSTRSWKPARSTSACSDSASRPAPTTCAKARWSSWPRRCSERV